MITAKRIIEGKSSVLYVTHDPEEGYQFLDGGEVTDDDAAVVALEAMVKLDPTLMEISTLAPGWVAARETPDGPWTVFPMDDDDDDSDDDDIDDPSA